jgi:hypothetical protein
MCRKSTTTRTVLKFRVAESHDFTIDRFVGWKIGERFGWVWVSLLKSFPFRE